MKIRTKYTHIYTVLFGFIIRVSQRKKMTINVTCMQSTLRPTNWVTPHKPMNIIRDSLLAKITRGISSGFGHMIATITRINTQALMCYYTLNIQGIYLYRVIISNDENYSVG